ncbi:MAG: flagellar hook-basal body complex protein [Desulfocapsaceae bacterium]|nr:flagellar hook-basal body complex protein [Desulfocapsaceae bacterium]
MGISSALYSGVSGLNADSQAMTVIGNNLANASTTGFKASSTTFSDLLSSTIYGSGGMSQVGRGAQVEKVQNDFSQGTFQTTQSGLDCAIEGAGFFCLQKPGDNTTYYSRAGSFSFDTNGYLVNPAGLRVQGQSYTASGTLSSGNPTDIQVSSQGLAPAQATSNITLNTNLDASSTEIPKYTAFNYTDPTTYNYSSSTQVYDSLGNTHLVTVYFRKLDEAGQTVADPTAPATSNLVTGDSTTSTPASGDFTFSSLLAGQTLTIEGRTITATGGTATAADIATAFATGTTTGNAVVSGAFTATWGATVSATDNTTIAVTNAAPGYPAAIPTATVGSVKNPQAANTWDYYWTSKDAAGNPIGQVTSGATPAGTLTFNTDGTLASGGTGTTTGAIDWAGGANSSNIKLNFNTTQFNSTSVVISQSQDGYGSGNLTGTSIDANGTVIASYSNGVQTKLASLVLGKFVNPGGLSAAGNNLFAATADSGPPRVGLPGSELGTIFTDSLEQSNVDTGTQFVQMITVQRAFQANSKIITTVDQMLQDVINMKQ